jgi:thiol-disulfide isomerase/thioredoxin
MLSNLHATYNEAVFMRCSAIEMRLCVALCALMACAPLLRAQATEAALQQRMDGLRALPELQRWAATREIAIDLRGLVAGDAKVKLADNLASLSTEGDPGQATLQVVGDTLAQSLRESPQAVEKDGSPAQPYMELARLVRYEGVTTTLDDALLTRASEMLAANDADVAKADFTLMSVSGRTYTLSELRGKVVLVNFWATWCPPCRREMKDLNVIYALEKARGLVVVSITSEGPGPVIAYLSAVRYRPPVLIDEDGAVAKRFHVDGLPRTFAFDRSGKLAAVAIDMRTRRQFFDMLAQAGLPGVPVATRVHPRSHGAR